MFAVPKAKFLTPEEYLAIEEKAEFKSEYFNGEMFAMAGASVSHNTVNENLSVEIGNRLKGSGCRSFSRDLRLRADATGLYTYPDLIIVCGPREYDPRNKDTLLNPTVVFEILSPSTEAYDRGTKFQHYGQIASIREIVLISQDAMVVEVFERQTEDRWILTTFRGPNASMKLSTAGLAIPLPDIYRDVEFPETLLRVLPTS
jgi:Uma2 family endonuclease